MFTKTELEIANELEVQPALVKHVLRETDSIGKTKKVIKEMKQEFYVGSSHDEFERLRRADDRKKTNKTSS